jgi:uncharacterized membrane protein
MKYSKNMYWLIVALVALVALLAMILNVILDPWNFSVLMGLMFMISVSQYMKYRKWGL